MDKKRTFQQIAKDIKSTWLNVYFGAVPYLEAMLTLDTSDPNAMYFYNTAGDIVRYFLANAQTFRGADAKRLKAELKSMLVMDEILKLLKENNEMLENNPELKYKIINSFKS